jgi:hypothetical protein
MNEERNTLMKFGKPCRRLWLLANPVAVLCAALFLAIVTGVLAAQPAPSGVDSAALRRWQDMRFGMFIHWGPVSLTGREIGWARGAEIPIAERGQGLIDFVRALQPDIVINNRTGAPGDFDTPEQQIGGFNRERPWETCMTICRQWAWKPDDTMKSLEQCLRTLMYTAGGDGNLLFNVGPMPDGRFAPASSVCRFLTRPTAQPCGSFSSSRPNSGRFDGGKTGNAALHWQQELFVLVHAPLGAHAADRDCV